MSDFKGRHFEGEIVLWAVRWYCRYGVSYRDLEQMLRRARRIGRPFDDLPLGPEIRSRDPRSFAKDSKRALCPVILRGCAISTASPKAKPRSENSPDR